MHEDHVPKTAIVTLFGTFEFLRMQLDLKNSAKAFQRLMDSIFGSIPFVFVYLVASKSIRDHLDNLSVVFTILRDNGLFITVDKCLLGVDELGFLSHRVCA